MPINAESALFSSLGIVSDNNQNPFNRIYHIGSSGKLDNLSKLIRQDLHVMSSVSSQAPKHGIDELLGEIQEAQTKFDQIQNQMQILIQARTYVHPFNYLYSSFYQTQLKKKNQLERDLLLLMKKVKKMKSIFPFALVAKPEPLNSHVNWRDRSTPRTVSAPDKLMQNLTFSDNHAPTFDHLNKSVRGLKNRSRICLIFFLAFPENTIIKKSLLVCWAKANEIAYLNEPVDDLIGKGLIHAVYKETLTVGGYWMHPFVRSTLMHEKWLRDSDVKECVYVADISSSKEDEKEEDDIIYDDSPSNSQFSAKSKSLRMLHLGNWQRSSARHVEVQDPDSFFKHFADGTSRLRYVSLRGVSLITEVPGFVTDLEDLVILDLKSCHNLEVVPPRIGNLWRTLTHLDMSECYFLEHMPIALSTLRNLRVLKGFVVRKITTTKNEEGRSCTLEDLRNLVDLRKLNIYTALKCFPTIDELTTLNEFKYLRSLTISWGGSSVIGNSEVDCTETNVTNHPEDPLLAGISFNLEKLDLQCVPESFTPNWLVPRRFEHLKNLYVRGGKLSGLDLEERAWNVEILRLKHLSNLEMDYRELVELFPKLICLEIVKCPKLKNFSSFRNGVWKKDAITEPPPAVYH